uniref:Uncharacterized protein n=1 Tax=Rhizophora mucronata TaxID=61149 RepID=A0A2P2N1N7_RHIMU
MPSPNCFKQKEDPSKMYQNT